MKIITIDENTGNPFPKKIDLADRLEVGFSHVAGEFYHNPKLIKSTAKILFQIIGLTEGQRTIDIGYGSNLSVAEAMDELGMRSHGLDSQDGRDVHKYPDILIIPPHFTREQDGIIKYCGTVEDILHPDSELRNKSFDLFNFWGSWDSGGNNFAIGGEMGWFRAVKTLEQRLGPTNLDGGNWDPYKNPQVNEEMVRTKDKILSDCRKLVTPNGGISIVSSRFAGHGAGFTIDELPWEKRVMLVVAQKFSELGAKEAYLFGISKGEVVRQIGNNPSLEEVYQALLDDSNLFRSCNGVGEREYSSRVLGDIKKINVPLGRIDAVYGRF